MALVVWFSFPVCVAALCAHCASGHDPLQLEITWFPKCAAPISKLIFPQSESWLVSFDAELNLTYWDKSGKRDSCRISVPRDYNFCNSAFLSSDGTFFFFG